MAENQNNNDNNENIENKDVKSNDYEDICYICRRPESVAGKMIHIQNDICICQDCMQKTFDAMNSGGFNMGDFMNMNIGKMPNISMINLSDLQGAVPKSQKLKKKKPKKNQLKNLLKQKLKKKLQLRKLENQEQKRLKRNQLKKQNNKNISP